MGALLAFVTELLAVRVPMSPLPASLWGRAWGRRRRRETSQGAALAGQPTAPPTPRQRHGPHVSNDNPYSEAQFKTLKYRPDFPERFGSEQDARVFSREFMAWYNGEHRHSGICMLTPASVHYGQAEAILLQRHRVMLAAYEAHPERFSRPPRRRHLPESVWINRPKALAGQDAGQPRGPRAAPPTGSGDRGENVPPEPNT